MELRSPDQLSTLPAVADTLLRYLERLPLAGERRAVVFADALAHGVTPGRALTRFAAPRGSARALGRPRGAQLMGRM
jgi:hypothetical protein